ncbi:MAG: UDP-4-amino-4-deoxy-L-arabinose aminotransferase [Spartobacteria bacterium]|nr:UDP-4-amino-4-deoxy-L-arabinose aminotransferase [Spartobacteria bacterium]
MRDAFLPFCVPSLSEETIEAVGQVLRSGWITTGPWCAKLEAALKDYVGCDHALAVSAATGGMHCALLALGIGPGDEVITPSMTWVSTPNLISLLGAKPVFVDVDRDTLLMTPEAAEAAITPRTKAVIPVHYAGAPVDLDAFEALAQKHQITLIEDAAHAIGTRYKGRHVGQRGLAIFSFHPIKNMTTCEGGAVVVDDPELADRIKQFKFHGLSVDAFDRKLQGRTPKAMVQYPGYKYNMTDVAAVIGCKQLESLDGFHRRRIELTMAYRNVLADIPGITPLSDPTYEHTHARDLMIVRVEPEKAGLDRDAFMLALKERNIGTGLHFLAAHLHTYYQKTLNTGYGMLPNTEWNTDRICSIPLFPGMTDEDFNDVVDAIRDVVQSAKKA